MYFEYDIHFYNEFDDVEEHRAGVVFAGTCVEAMNELASFYGNDNIESVSLYPLDCDSCYEFSDESHHFKLEIVD